MPPPASRRRFLQAAATTGAALGLSDWTPLLRISPVRAQEASVTPDLVRFSPDIEPIVRLIEETPQDKCIEMMVEQLRRGLPYRNFLAALYLASVRAAKWHGGFHGFDHMAYVIHSIQQLSLDLPPAERLLPAFWALYGFKGGQLAYKDLKRTRELTGDLPPAERATDELHAGLREWDPARAERAVVALVRSQPPRQAIESLWHYAGRDWRFIGHLAILTSNSWRLLQTIGWQHAEPVLRYVVEGLSGWSKDDKEGPEHQPYRANLERVARNIGKLPADWAAVGSHQAVTRELVALIRDDGSAACEFAAVQLVGGRCQAGAVWDAVHLAAGELLLGGKLVRGKLWNGDALHANTATNALHYAFRASTQAENRLLLLLQGVAWVNLFRDLLKSRHELEESRDITGLVGVDLPDQPQAAIEDILATRTADPLAAGRKAFAFAQRAEGARPLLRTAARLVALKVTDVHDIKLAVAIGEDHALLSPEWRPHQLAAGVYSFRGSDQPDNAVTQQVREAARGL